MDLEMRGTQNLRIIRLVMIRVPRFQKYHTESDLWNHHIDVTVFEFFLRKSNFLILCTVYLPDPVTAEAQRSRPSNAIGTVAAWIGVGECRPIAERA